MNATRCISGQNKIRYLYSVFVILYAVRGVKGLIKNFELRIDSMECTGPAVVEGKGLGEGLADDVACLVGKEKLRVKRDDLDCEGGALGGELRIEGFQMKEDCLFGLEHLGCALAGDGDENDVFGFHIDRIFYLKTILVNWVVNECQFEDDFFVTKIRFTLFATKINKNLELSFVFVQMNAAHCIGGQNKNYNNVCHSFK